MSKYTNIPFVKYSATGNDFILIDKPKGLAAADRAKIAVVGVG